MSQMTATTAPAPRARRRSATIPPLRLVRSEARVTSSAIPFVLICSFVLAAGLICLLLLNTALVKGSYEAHQLESTSAELSEREQSLRELLAAREGPQGLAARAAQLGMVQPEATRWLDLATGKVTGIAKPAGSEPQAVVTEPSFEKTPTASVTVGPDGRATPVPSPNGSAPGQVPGEGQAPGQPAAGAPVAGVSPNQAPSRAGDAPVRAQGVAPRAGTTTSPSGATRGAATPSRANPTPSGSATGAR